jgi:hypothetical protein
VAVAYITELSQNLLEGIDENHKNPQSASCELNLVSLENKTEILTTAL